MRMTLSDAVAIEAIRHAQRLNPLFVNAPYLSLENLLHVSAGNYAAAIHCFEANLVRGGPVGPFLLAIAAVSYAELGQSGQSEEQMTTLRNQFAQFQLKNWNYLKLYKDTEVRERIYRQLVDVAVPA